MAENSNRFERNPRKTLLAVFAVFLLLSVGLTEYVLEKKLPEPPLQRSLRLKEHYPNFSSTLPGPSAGDILEEKDYPFRVDNDGYLVPSKVYEEPDLSIVFLGESSTECRFVEETSRFAYRAGVLLGEHFNKKINSYNAGAGGGNAMHSLNLLLNKALAVRPQVVVFMHNLNDLNVLLLAGSYWNDHPTKSLIVTDDRREHKFRRWLATVGETVFPGLCYKLGIGAAFDADDEEFSWKPPARLSAPDFVAAEFECTVATFVNLCKARAILPVLMTPCTRLDAGGDEITRKNLERLVKPWGLEAAVYVELFRRCNDVIRKVAAERGALLIDLDALAPKDKTHLYDLVHLNTKGSELVASLVAEHLARSLAVQNLLREESHSNGAFTSK